MKDQIREDPKIVAAAERRMKAWSLCDEIEQRQLRLDTARAPRDSVHSFVAISREAGAGGAEIGRLVGAALGWVVFDRGLLLAAAQRLGVDPLMLELVDETESNWVYDVLGTWMDWRIVPHERYVAALERVVLAAAMESPAVFVGRGAQFILPRDRGLAVRVVAPDRCRVERLARRERLSTEDARRRMIELDRGRADFVRRFFHHDVSDATLYDLVINTARISPDEAAEQIAALARRRFTSASALPAPHVAVAPPVAQRPEAGGGVIRSGTESA